MHVRGRGRRQCLQQTRLEHGVHAVEGHERAIRCGRERGRDGVRLMRAAQVRDPHLLAPEAGDRGRAERAQDRGGHAQARGAHGGDDGAPADRGVEDVGLHFLAGARQAIEAHEDQVFEGFTGREQSRSGHAGLYPATRAAGACAAAA
jgi:hypothetical protein